MDIKCTEKLNLFSWDYPQCLRCICYLTFHKSTASNRKMRIPTSKLMAMIHPTTYPRGSRLCKASKTTYKAIRKIYFYDWKLHCFLLYSCYEIHCMVAWLIISYFIHQTNMECALISHFPFFKFFFIFYFLWGIESFKWNMSGHVTSAPTKDKVYSLPLKNNP